MWVSWTPTLHCVTPRGATRPSLNTPSSSDPHVKRSSAVVTITRNKEEATLLYLKQIYVFPDHYFFGALKNFICFLYRCFSQDLQLMLLQEKLWSTVTLKIDKTGIPYLKTIFFFFFFFFNNVRKSQWRKVMCLIHTLCNYAMRNKELSEM